MQTRRLVLVATFLLMTFLCHSSALALDFGARANYWLPAVSSTLRVYKDTVVGTTIDFKDDLGVKFDNVPFVEAYLGLGNHEVTFMYAHVHCSGEKNIEKTINFNGNVFNVNAFVESEMTARIFDLEYQYKLINFKNILAGLSFGIVLKVKYIDAEAKLHSSTAGSTYDEKQNLRVPVPMLGLAAQVGILANILEARAKVTGMGYSNNYFYDAMADVAVTPFPFLDIHAGYRAMAVKVDNISDVYADMRFYGPYAGLKIGF
jgi:hypothetical protein